MFKRLLVLVCWVALASVTLYAQTGNLQADCVAEYDAETDYFPDKVEVRYAENFSVEYHANYKVVEVLPWQGAEDTLTYVLVQCGTPAPADVEADAVINVPVQRFVSMSTTILPHLITQGVDERLIAVDTLMYTNSAEILARTDLAEIGAEWSGINIELLLELEPDLVMTQQFSAEGTVLGTLEGAGVATVLNSDFADVSPLAQAEWGKYVALFFNTEAQANEAFATVESEYQALTALTAELSAEERPTVLAASAYDGTWYMPAGGSTIAQLIADAGASFVFADLEGTSVPLDMETVIERGSSAEFWVNINQFWATTADVVGDDARYADFSAFQAGNLWNNNLRMNANGGSDYFESGVANPQWILADLIAIFHPELLPDHEFIYYQRLSD